MHAVVVILFRCYIIAYYFYGGTEQAVVTYYTSRNWDRLGNI